MLLLLAKGYLLLLLRAKKVLLRGRTIRMLGGPSLLLRRGLILRVERNALRVELLWLLLRLLPPALLLRLGIWMATWRADLSRRLLLLLLRELRRILGDAARMGHNGSWWPTGARHLQRHVILPWLVVILERGECRWMGAAIRLIAPVNV